MMHLLILHLWRVWEVTYKEKKHSPSLALVAKAVPELSSRIPEYYLLVLNYFPICYENYSYKRKLLRTQ